MERDVNIFKVNRRLILTTGILLLVVAVIYSLSIFVGGDFYDFCKGAISWVLMGISVACATAYISQKE